MTIDMTISERALESMVLAACEAYAFGKDDGCEAVETYAHLWGFRRSSPNSGTDRGRREPVEWSALELFGPEGHGLPRDI